ncbi:MAG: hypothetical protein A2Z68_01690 [Candidatus Nealsonbacteria bacterium RBG_13_38_11]|uniref:4-vinyl reductase 4VR domain-containing protein n=1 Tax=Candidatus Nealsonbacteria bacterium RBG_13_38_11 TaxID=1801662 RepID=A0A1G2DZY0_9BACT|nr:MAG: hypothetical protein A2Z68_01690 [Candidatus Nealsonbacteria bacterium RBG_13_38_11]
MTEILTKEITDRLLKIKGECRGFAIKQDGDYILKEKGKEGLGKLEKELEKAGYPLKYSEMNNMKFYPAGLRALSLLAIKKAFNIDDEEIRKVCAFQPKTSLIVRLFAKYFYSVPAIMKKTQDLWAKYWNIGKLTFVEYNDKEKRAIVRIEDIDLDPIWCRCNEGYMASLAELVVGKGTKNIQCKELKCPSKGDKYHEFLITY